MPQLVTKMESATTSKFQINGSEEVAESQTPFPPIKRLAEPVKWVITDTACPTAVKQEAAKV